MGAHARFGSVLAAALPMVFSAPALGQLSRPVHLIQIDGDRGDRFGNRVAISEDTVVVTAHYDDVGGNAGQGSASVYRRAGAGWVFEAILTAADGAADDHFGTSVVISGDMVVIGAEFDNVGENADQGSAYVFTRSGTTWTQQAKLVAGDGAADDAFGYSCTISRDTVVVGAHNAHISGRPRQGAAYVFMLSGSDWTQQAKLTASDGEAIDYFGTSVALSAEGDILAIGAARDTVDGHVDQGSAYVFTRSGTVWTQQAKLTASDGTTRDAFGFSLVIVGDTLFVSAYIDDVGANFDQGSVYIFTRSDAAWTEQSKLTAADGGPLDAFGWSLAVSAAGDKLAVGAGTRSVGESFFQGGAYIFTSSGETWNLQDVILAPDGARYDWFGTSVAISPSGGAVLVGSVQDDIGANVDQGSAWVFSIGSNCRCDWNDDARLNSQDYFDFLKDFFNADADYNGSGRTNSQDYFDFLTCLFAPPQSCM